MKKGKRKFSIKYVAVIFVVALVLTIIGSNVYSSYRYAKVNEDIEGIVLGSPKQAVQCWEGVKDSVNGCVFAFNICMAECGWWCIIFGGGGVHGRFRGLQCCY